MKKTIPVLLFWLLGTCALAGIQTEEVLYRQGDQQLEGYLAYDDSLEGKRPAVLIVHEWWGLTEHPKRSARQLAEAGYVAFALDMYGKEKSTDSPQQAGQWAGAIRGNPDLARKRFVAAMDVIKKRENVDHNRIAAIGYCFGGTIVLEMARMGLDLDGVASFHGGLSSSLKDDQRKPITAAVLALHGAADTHVSMEEVSAFQTEMTEAGADWHMVTYGGAKHSFTNPAADARGMEGVGYDEDADRRSWWHMRIFLKDVFGESVDLGLPSLEARLQGQRKKFQSNAPEEMQETFQQGTRQVRQRGIEQKAKGKGDKAPDFTLTDLTGNKFQLSKALKKGPVILQWYRGGWCPYCNIQLRAWNEALPQVKKHGATLVAISPETAVYGNKTTESNQLDFGVLTDSGNQVAEEYGLVFALPEDVKKIYRERIDLEEYNADSSWELPVPATYVIDSSGRIRYAFVDADYTKRAEINEVIEVMKNLEQE